MMILYFFSSPPPSPSSPFNPLSRTPPPAEKGIEQPPAFRDVFFLLLFLGSLLAFSAATFVYVPTFLASDPFGQVEGNANATFITVGIITAASALFLSCGAFSFMMANAKTLITGCLWGSVIASVVSALVAFAMGSIVMALLLTAYAALVTCYGKLYSPLFLRCFHSFFLPFLLVIALL